MSKTLDSLTTKEERNIILLGQLYNNTHNDSKGEQIKVLYETTIYSTAHCEKGFVVICVESAGTESWHLKKNEVYSVPGWYVKQYFLLTSP